MKKIAVTGILFFIAGFNLQSQENADPVKTAVNNGSLYMSFGWHRAFYTRSTIQFRDHQTGNYNFKLIKAKAIDDNDLNIGKGIDAPQYSVRLGWLFKNKPGTGIEINFDHAKYILKQGQQVRVQGTINGNTIDTATLLHPAFLEYEHTDGANYWMINWVKEKRLWQSKNRRNDLFFLFKPGAGLVIPRSDTRIFGKPRNDKYHISGYVAGVESGIKLLFFKSLVAEFTFKGAFANYNNVLLYGSGRARQHWFSFQYLMLVGYQFNFKK